MDRVMTETISPAVPLVLEIVGSFRMRSQFIAIDNFPFRIGRAYDNDLILSDDTVSPHHLVIDSQEGGIVIENVSSENGTSLNDAALNLSVKEVVLPATLSVGRTHLRLLRTDTVVVPTKPLARLSRATELCSNLRVALVLLLAYLLGNIYVAIESQSLWMNSGEVVVGELLQLLLPLAAAMVMSFISHLLTHYWRFPLQLSIASIALILQLLLDEFYSFVSYLLTSGSVAEILNTLLSIFLFTLLMAWQLRAISHLSPRLSTSISGSIIGSLFIVFILQEEVGRPEFIGQPMMHTLLRVSDLRFADDIATVTDFTEQVRSELMVGITENHDES